MRYGAIEIVAETALIGDVAKVLVLSLPVALAAV